MTRKQYIFLIFCLLIQFSGKAQSDQLFFDFTSGGGTLIPHPKMKNLGGPVTFFNARLGLKTWGKKEWQRVYNYPEIGLGVSHNYLTTKSLGNPTAVYSFMNLPLITGTILKLNLGMHLGLTWGFNPYREQYPQDEVIGSKLAAYTSLNLNSSFQIVHRLELLVAAEMYHLSNGNTNKPNKGINMLGAEAGVRYMISNTDVVRNSDPVIPAHRNSSFMVFGTWGTMRESTSYAGRVTVGSLSAGIYRTINHKSRLCAGVDLLYDEGNLNEIQKENRLKNVLAAGVFGGHELTFDKLSMVTQVGIYLHNPVASDPLYYTRLGLRYAVTKRIIPSVTMKAHGISVDFLEWGCGFVLWDFENRKVH
jgi:hypothetical protein